MEAFYQLARCMVEGVKVFHLLFADDTLIGFYGSC